MAKNDKDGLIGKAERLYIYLGMTYKEIAEELGKSERTISRWAEEEEWKKKKAANESGPEKLCQALLEENLSIVEKAKEEKRSINSREADIIYKNAATIKVFQKSVNLLSASAVFKQYNNWLVETNPDLAKANTEYQRKFLTQLASEH